MVVLYDVEGKWLGIHFFEIMRRHIRPEDSGLTDDEFIRAVFKRYEDARNQPLIDPNE